MPDRGGPSRPRRLRVGAPSRRIRTLLLTLAVIVVLVVAWVLFANVMTDWLWYQSMGYSNVYTTRMWTRIGLFLVFGVVMAVAVGLNVWFAYRLRPTFQGNSLEQQSLDRYRNAIAPFRKWLLIGLSVVIGIIAGTSAAGNWRTWLEFVNSTPFGVKDPQFHEDVSFFAFELPFYRFIVDFLFVAVLVGLLLTILTHYLYGGLRVQAPGQRATPAAQAHLSLLLGLFVLLKAVAYWLDRYSLAVHSGNLKSSTQFTGLRYTDANAVLPAKTILFCVAIICSVLFFVNVFRRTWALPIIGFGLMVLSAVLIGGLYPAIVEQFQVKPNQQSKEAEYIQRNIDATRDAYNLDDSTTQAYGNNPQPASPALKAVADQTASFRIMDPNIVAPTFEQAQRLRNYYTFPQTLDVDRYTVNGNVTDTVLAVREINPQGGQTHNWVNDHTKYTHGYGVVAADGTQKNPTTGGPDYLTSDIQPAGAPTALGSFEPRIYFGEDTTTYSIVGAPANTAPTEVDHPENDPNAQVATYTYTGKGGVGIGSTFRKLLYATKFGDGNILLSDSINKDSRILYNRTPKERVEAVAPWLTIDGDPYPAVVDGHIEWILDGYTTSNGYPYSTRTTLGSATSDSLNNTDSARNTIGNTGNVNYIRNSVKATVDAYTGQVKLYQWDTQDPVLKTWMKAFPGTVEKKSAIPVDLLPHLRYPEDLFKVQRDLLSQYHVTDPKTFFNGSDFWSVPKDPTTAGNGTTADQPPYYLSMQLPGDTKQSFQLTSTFVPKGRTNLAAFMAVDADVNDPNYGKVRLLALPTETTVNGPEQQQNTFTADPVVAQQTNLLQQGGSVVKYGNLLSLPIGDSLLYVEPVYVQANAQNSFPILQMILASYNGKIAFETSLDQALTTVFTPGLNSSVQNVPGAGSGTTTPTPAPTQTTPTPAPSASAPATPLPSATPGGTANGPALAQALNDAQQAINDSNAALAKGDFTAYGQAQQRLKAAIDAAVAAENGQGAATTPPPTPNPAASSSPPPQ